MNGNAAVHAAQQVRESSSPRRRRSWAWGRRRSGHARRALRGGRSEPQRARDPRPSSSPRACSGRWARRATTTRPSSAATTVAAPSAPRPLTRSPRTWPRSRSIRRPGAWTLRPSGWRTTAARPSARPSSRGRWEGSAVHGRGRGHPRGARHRRGRLAQGAEPPRLQISTSLDVPDLVALLVESNDPEGPKGAKEAGEGPCSIPRSPPSPTPSTTPLVCASTAYPSAPPGCSRRSARRRPATSAPPRPRSKPMLPLPIFDFHKPRTVSEALGLLAQLGDRAQIIAGDPIPAQHEAGPLRARAGDLPPGGQ